VGVLDVGIESLDQSFVECICKKAKHRYLITGIIICRTVIDMTISQVKPITKNILLKQVMNNVVYMILPNIF